MLKIFRGSTTKSKSTWLIAVSFHETLVPSKSRTDSTDLNTTSCSYLNNLNAIWSEERKINFPHLFFSNKDRLGVSTRDIDAFKMIAENEVLGF